MTATFPAPAPRASATCTGSSSRWRASRSARMATSGCWVRAPRPPAPARCWAPSNSITTTGPGTCRENFRKLNAVARWSLGAGRRQLRPDGDGLQRQVELDRPDSEAAPWIAGLGRPLRLARSDRRRRERAREPVARLEPDVCGRQLPAERLCGLRSRLDLFSNFTFLLAHPFDRRRSRQWRPVPAIGEAQHDGPERFARPGSASLAMRT